MNQLDILKICTVNNYKYSIPLKLLRNLSLKSHNGELLKNWNEITDHSINLHAQMLCIDMLLKEIRLNHGNTWGNSWRATKLYHQTQTPLWMHTYTKAIYIMHI